MAFTACTTDENSDEVVLKLDPVNFSVDEGSYQEPLTIDLSSDESGSTILYSIDASLEDNSQVYNDPLVLSESGTYIVRAKTIKSGFEDSDIVQKTYTLNIQSSACLLKKIQHDDRYYDSIVYNNQNKVTGTYRVYSSYVNFTRLDYDGDTVKMYTSRDNASIDNISNSFDEDGMFVQNSDNLLQAVLFNGQTDPYEEFNYNENNKLNYALRGEVSPKDSLIFNYTGENLTEIIVFYRSNETSEVFSATHDDKINPFYNNFFLSLQAGSDDVFSYFRLFSQNNVKSISSQEDTYNQTYIYNEYDFPITWTKGGFTYHLSYNNCN
ncbi:chitobiase/beta-hexosaminidase C-terminal domain-containing protein [Marivirga tractuosa]|uniref:chitobiase/beta-hexosaminidase C-terminal domain-containing protein n=1 Tax=Marivirga tractuosa TaxID=1006 RepID=UPI0030C88A1E